jgi:hypothetical protein
MRGAWTRIAAIAVGAIAAAGALGATSASAQGHAHHGKRVSGPRGCGRAAAAPTRGHSAGVIRSQAEHFAAEDGIPLAQAEHEMEIQVQAGPINEDLERELGQGYAGLYFDDKTGLFHIGIAPSTNRGVAETVVRNLGVLAYTSFDTVAHTWAEVEAAAHTLQQQLASLMRSGQHFQVGTDPSSNGVRIELADDVSAAQVAEVEAAVRSAAVATTIVRVPAAALHIVATAGVESVRPRPRCHSHVTARRRAHRSAKKKKPKTVPCVTPTRAIAFGYVHGNGVVVAAQQLEVLCGGRSFPVSSVFNATVGTSRAGSPPGVYCVAVTHQPISAFALTLLVTPVGLPASPAEGVPYALWAPGPDCASGQFEVRTYLLTATAGTLTLNPSDKVDFSFEVV